MNNLINAPQNIMRKLALFRRLRADIEAFRATSIGERLNWKSN